MCRCCQSHERQATFAVVGVDVGLAEHVQPHADDTECADCGEQFRPIAENENTAGEPVCDDCADNYVRCYDCNEVIHRDDSLTSPDGDDYCECCYDNRYTTCDCCYETFCREDVRHYDCQDWCDDCFWDVYTECDNCGDTIHRDHCNYCDHSGCVYCDDCHTESTGCASKGFYRGRSSCRRMGSFRSYGVELETSECDGFEDLDGETVFTSEYDGSISGEEFVSDVLSGDAGLDEIEEFCERANDLGFSVDNQCGYHLHIGVQDLTDAQLRSVAKAYAKCANVWRSFVPASRRGNCFCPSLEWDCASVDNATSFDHFARCQNRYQWLNVSAYAKHSTLEVRLHTATLSGQKVCNWVVAHIKFVDWVAENGDAAFDGLTDQEIFDKLSEIWDSPELTDFYAGRARKFGTHYNVLQPALCAAPQPALCPV